MEFRKDIESGTVIRGSDSTRALGTHSSPDFFLIKKAFCIIIYVCEWSMLWECIRYEK